METPGGSTNLEWAQNFVAERSIRSRQPRIGASFSLAMSTVGWGQRDDRLTYPAAEQSARPAVGDVHTGAAAGAAPVLLSETPRTTASFGMWPFVEVLRRSEVPLERICELTDITPAQVRDPEFRFTQATVNRIVGLAFDVIGPTAAVAAALTVEAGHFQLLELIARSAPKVGNGLEQVCRFFPLLHDGGQLVHELAADGSHTLRWIAPTAYEVHYGCLELTFAVGLLGMRRETGRESCAPSAVWFYHAAPPDPVLHERVFGPVIHYGMTEARMTFDRATAALPLTRSNSSLHATAIRTAADAIED